MKCKRKQKNKDGQQVKHQDHFCCTIMCQYCGKHRHHEEESHIKCRGSEKIKKAKEQGRNNADNDNPGGEALILGDPPVRVTLVEDEGQQPPKLYEEERQILHPGVSSRLTSRLYPLPQAFAAPKRAWMQRSASSSGTSSARRMLGWK